MKFHRAQRGQVIVLVALSVTVLLGFLGLATDVGLLWATKRKAQTAADAAAVAGVNATLTTQSGSYAAAATDVASINGFTNGQNSIVVTPSEPTPAGFPAGNYVQVDISAPVQTYFLGVLGYRTVNIKVSALAGNTSSPNTIVGLNPSAPQGVTVDGPQVSVSCGIMSNSTGSGSLTVKNGGSITATTIGVVGGTSGTVPSNTKTHCGPVQDPFGSWTPPSPSSCTRQSTNHSGSNTITTTCTVASNTVYDGGSGNCGHVIQSPFNSHTHTYTPITVSFSGGNCGNHISLRRLRSGNLPECHVQLQPRPISMREHLRAVAAALEGLFRGLCTPARMTGRGIGETHRSASYAPEGFATPAIAGAGISSKPGDSVVS